MHDHRKKMLNIILNVILFFVDCFVSSSLSIVLVIVFLDNYQIYDDLWMCFLKGKVLVHTIYPLFARLAIIIIFTKCN